jgi:uncharacterized repeat protein (TIGR02543 family)
MKQARKLLAMFIASTFILIIITAVAPPVKRIAESPDVLSSTTVELGVAGATDTIATVRSAIQEAIDGFSGSGGQVYVTGSFTATGSQSPPMPINVANGIRLDWQAATNLLIEVTNGRFEVNGGSIASITARGYTSLAITDGIVGPVQTPAVNLSDNVTLFVTGGEIRGGSGIAIWSNNNAMTSISGGLVTSFHVLGDQGTIGLRNNSTLTITGGTVRNTETHMPNTSVIAVRDDSRVSVSGEALIVASTQASMRAINVLNNGIVNITGGSITHSSINTGARAINSGGNSQVFIHGGEITVNHSSARFSTASNGVIIETAYETPATYEYGTSTDLTIHPDTALIRWDTVNNSHGFSFERGTNRGFTHVRNVTVTGTPAPIERIVTFNTNGGTFQNASDATRRFVFQGFDAHTVGTLPTPAKVNYTFNGWYLDEEFTTRALPTTPVTDDMTIYARWTIITRTLRLETSQSSVSTINVSTTTRNQGAEIPISAGNNPTNHIFTHWSASPAVTFADASSPNTTFVMPASNVTVSANYGRIQHQLTVNSFSENATASGLRGQGLSVTVTAGTAPPNHRFVNWVADGITLTDSQRRSTSISFTMPARPVTLTAVFEAVTANVTVVSSGGGASQGGQHNQGSTVQISAGVPPTDYRFVRWTTGNSSVNFANANSPDTSFVMPGGSVTVTAVFERYRHEVTVSSVGFGSSSESFMQGRGITVEVFAGNPPANYRFAQWIAISIPEGVTLSDSANPRTSFTMPNNDVALIAMFERISLTVTFYPNGGSAVSPMTIAPGGTLTTLPAPTRHGYKFMGWYSTSNFMSESRITGTTVVLGDLLLWARWETDTSADNPCTGCNIHPCVCPPVPPPQLCETCGFENCLCFELPSLFCPECRFMICMCNATKPEPPPPMVSRTTITAVCEVCNIEKTWTVTVVIATCPDTWAISVAARTSVKFDSDGQLLESCENSNLLVMEI